MEKKCGIVAILGAPNAGKSTLINRLVGQKISIVTPKVQTTRESIRGIVNIDQCQLIFLDTPGIFKADRKLGKAIVKNAIEGLAEADIICILFDANSDLSKNDIIINKIRHYNSKIKLAIINKIDLVDKKKLLTISDQINKLEIFDHIFMISALDGDGVLDTVNYLCSNLPINPWLYQNDELTDTSVRRIAEEITREQLFLQLHQELPYSLKVDTDMWQEKEGNSIFIHQSIWILKQSQKAIILGNKGQMIKKISQNARIGISKMLDNDAKIHLFLHVKVRADWIDRDYKDIK